MRTTDRSRRGLRLLTGSLFAVMVLISLQGLLRIGLGYYSYRALHFLSQPIAKKGAIRTEGSTTYIDSKGVDIEALTRNTDAAEDAIDRVKIFRVGIAAASLLNVFLSVAFLVGVYRSTTSPSALGQIARILMWCALTAAIFGLAIAIDLIAPHQALPRLSLMALWQLFAFSSVAIVVLELSRKTSTAWGGHVFAILGSGVFVFNCALTGHAFLTEAGSLNSMRIGFANVILFLGTLAVVAAIVPLLRRLNFLRDQLGRKTATRTR